MAGSNQIQRLLATIAIWPISHGAIAASLQTMERIFPEFSIFATYALLFGALSTQAFLLRRHLKWWALAWIPASFLGIVLSFTAIWWFWLFVGLGLGTSQACVLAAARIRRAWVWPLASGSGWFLGIVAGSAAASYLLPHLPQWQLELPVLHTSTLSFYGCFLGLTTLLLHPRDG